jgi:phosphoglycerate dehydrogenase-like enzyme
MPDILVLRRGTHGLSMADYADALADRLPEHDVHLARTHQDERESIADATVVTGMDVDEALLERAEDLACFASIYAGTDHLPMAELEARGVAVTSASGVHGPNIAEHVIGQILAFVRRFHEGWKREQRREWRHYQADELAGSTVTVVGQGPIGQAIVERLEPFDVHTVAARYTPSKGGPADEIIGLDRDALHDAFADTDHLVLACPLTDETRDLLDEEAFVTLPTSATVVNIARGPVIDTDALVTAIRRNRIHGAALDVTDPEPLPEDHPLWSFDNVRLTPHNSGHTPAYFERLADIVAPNVERIEAGKLDDLENRAV